MTKTPTQQLRDAALDAYNCFRVYADHMPAYMHGEPLKDHIKRLRKALDRIEAEGVISAEPVRIFCADDIDRPDLP